MDINILVLNVGNSRLAAGSFVSGELMLARRADIDDLDACRAVISECWTKLGGHTSAAVAGASVNPSMDADIESIVREVCDRRIQWVGTELDLPIDVLTQPPSDTGVDRVLNVAAAFEQAGRACVVVDAGTALSMSFCNDSGDLVGGAIGPGASLMLQALHNHTAKLPLVKLERPTTRFGESTADAIRFGVYHGIRGLVREVVEHYATEIGHWPEVIATGGDAMLLFDGWEVVSAVSPDLTLYGIAHAYAEHHIKHGT